MFNKIENRYSSRQLKVVCLGLLFVSICLSSCFNKGERQGLYPVLDFNENYPEREFSLDDAGWDYIPLETTPEALADRDFNLRYVSDSRIVGINRSRGDVLIFGRDGKVISSFNNRGSSGIDYQSLRLFVYDEVNKEIFIADALSLNRCVVYSEDGQFLRQFYFPEGSWIGDLYNFNDTTLLAYNGFRPASSDSDDEALKTNQKTPYVFISKKDGSFISRVDLSFPERLSDAYVEFPLENTMRQIRIGYSHRREKYDDEFVIADFSSDTIYLLTQDKNLKPLFVRKPSVFSRTQFHTIVLPHFKTDKHLFIYALTYNMPRVVELTERGENTSEAMEMPEFVLDLQTGEFFKPKGKFPAGRRYLEAPANTSVELIGADWLVERLKAGRLDGKLKQVAETLKEEDNPVVQIYDNVKID